MTWQEMSDEIATDVVQITIASPDIEYVVGVIQWQNKLLAGPVFQPNIFPLNLRDGETPVHVNGIAILPAPATAPDGHWRPIELKVTPKKNGSPTTEDTPVMYLVARKQAGGTGVVFPSRFYSSGRVQWSGNPEVIDEVRRALVKAGILISVDRPVTTK
jgi:hypothetical protein